MYKTKEIIKLIYYIIKFHDTFITQEYVKKLYYDNNNCIGKIEI